MSYLNLLLSEGIGMLKDFSDAMHELQNDPSFEAEYGGKDTAKPFTQPEQPTNFKITVINIF